MPVFTTILIRQMSLNLRRIHSLGINKIAVGLLEPIGCMPLLTVASSYEKCLEPFNLISQNHSQMLLQIVQELNKELGKPVFVTLDLYNSFLSVISTMQKRHSGKVLCFHYSFSWVKLLKKNINILYFKRFFKFQLNNAKCQLYICLRVCYFRI